MFTPDALAATDDDLVAAEADAAAPVDGAQDEADWPGEENEYEEVVEYHVPCSKQDSLGYFHPGHG